MIPVEGEATEAMRVTGLDPSVEYSVRARAFSIGGDGPWSNVFNGTTLQTGIWNCVLYMCVCTFVVACNRGHQQR